MGTLSRADEVRVSFVNRLAKGELACVDGFSCRFIIRGIAPPTDWRDWWVVKQMGSCRWCNSGQLRSKCLRPQYTSAIECPPHV